MSTPQRKIPVAISSCLLGENVRYDGGHRYAQRMIQRLGERFDFRPVCPEVAIGLGVPRDPIQLVSTSHGVQVRGVDDDTIDVTTRLEQFADTSAQEMDMICGYIFKARSPSCGIRDVKIVNEEGQLLHTSGVGHYAKSIIEALPYLPVADENQLQQPTAIDQFIKDVTQYYTSRHDQ